MNGKKLGNIPHNMQVFFTDAEFEVARLIYVNQQRAANQHYERLNRLAVTARNLNYHTVA